MLHPDVFKEKLEIYRGKNVPDKKPEPKPEKGKQCGDMPERK